MKKLLSLTGISTALMSSKSALAEYGLNMTQGVTSTSQDIYDLHMLIFWVCVVIGVVVFGAIFYSIISFRKSQGAKAAHFHESTTVELIWTGIPILILIAMAIPASKVLIDIEVLDKADMTVKITGHQWKWQYEYPEQGIGYISNLAQTSKDAIGSDKKPENYLLEVDNPLVLPVDTKIRFLITSSDVIHNWWVPELAVKQDGNPGFINDSWTEIAEEGVYRGQCAELCGKDHGFMPIVVEAVSKDAFAAWIADQKAEEEAAAASATIVWSEEELMASGENIYNASCSGCHQKDGSGIPGVFPAMSGSSITNGPAADHLSIVINGKGGMPAFKMLGDSDLASVITYERRAFGNNGSVVQPSDVTSAR